MSNASGWGLTARLVSKHFGVLGNKISEAIANFDPETATEADRDRLAETLRETAQLLASSRAAFDKERNDVISLQNLIANDEKATETLAQRLAAGTIAEATVTMFCDELEANKGRLPQEIQEEADAKAYMDELQKIVDALSKQLSEFDAQAKKAMQALASAKAQKPLDQQAEIDAIRKSVSQPASGAESALDRLKRLSGKPTPPQLPQ
jgi:signal transduction protein with GAF and PtsI domain